LQNEIYENEEPQEEHQTDIEWFDKENKEEN
jgi:hypothetical protein